MSAPHLTAEAQRENAAALAGALGLTTTEAAKALELTIAITVDAADRSAAALAADIAQLLERTVQSVVVDYPSSAPAAELVIGDAAGQTEAQKLYLSVTAERAVLSRSAFAREGCHPVHGLLRSIVACYACAATLACALDRDLPFGPLDPFSLSFDVFGVDMSDLTRPIELGHTYLAGAGAIGNGLLWAARHLDLRGRLELADDDRVDSGNLNRQMWFGVDDIGHLKVDRLALYAQPAFPKLELVPRAQRIQDLLEKSDGPWLVRLISAVDSRRARRRLQNEFPGEVFDASTTDIREIVLHYNRQPATIACLSCIYAADEDELSREQHIADHLGVPVEEVRSERITAQAAATIRVQFPSLGRVDLVGTAYDSLFKRLCGEGLLKMTAGRTLMAPFAFVSVLAGALLALELVRRLGTGCSERDFNYWRVSAWHPPLARARVTRPPQAGCTFCGNPLLRRVNSSLWGA